MTSDEIRNLQFKTISDAVDELKQANTKQAEFNTEVVRFMSSVTTWGKAGLILWGLGQVFLGAILLQLVGGN